MPTITKRNGELFTWTGSARCWCTHCEILFNGATAFTRHIRGKEHVEPESVGLELADNGAYSTKQNDSAIALFERNKAAQQEKGKA